MTVGATRKRRTRIILLGILAVLVLLAFWGWNDIAYLSQAIRGHFRVMGSREPIEGVLESESLDDQNQRKLKLILDVRAYAADELGLPRNNSYTVYSKIEGQYLGWNVYCAPQLSVEPKQWCFPVAGCVVYRGYFCREDALDFAEKMEKEGWDTFIGPINAYSTLGWYDDPVLSSHLELDSIRLAALIIHELAHQQFYLSGDSRFNEGFAVAVERTGVVQWLRSKGMQTDVAQAQTMRERDDSLSSAILEARLQLSAIYESELSTATLLEKKRRVFQELKRDLCGATCAGVNLPRTNGGDIDLNNAYLVSVDTYYSLVSAFEGILDSLGGSLPRFFEAVEELGTLQTDERQRRLQSFLKSGRGEF